MASIRPPGRPKKVRNAARRVTVSPDFALAQYLALGEKRSIRALHRKLEAEGEKIGYRHLQQWSKANNWVEISEGFDREHVEAADLGIRQARLGRGLQAVAQVGVDRLLRETPITGDIRALSAAAKAGVDIERTAVSEAPSDSTARYNEVAVAFLRVFVQVVADLPDDVRERVTRRFANGVNDVRGLTTEPAVADRDAPLLAAPAEPTPAEQKEVIDV